jgi:hypothetical protein
LKAERVINGSYVSVGTGKTVSDGTVSMVLYAGFTHRFSVYDSTGTLKLVQDMQATSTPIYIILNNSLMINGVSLWSTILSTSYGCVNSSAGVTCSYYDPAADFVGGRLKVWRTGFVLNTTVCDNITISGSIVSLHCALNTSAGNSYFYAFYANQSGQYYTLSTGWLEAATAQVYGTLGLLVMFFFVCVFAFMGIYNPVIGILFTTIAVIISYGLGFFSTTMEAIISLVCVAGILIWLLRT